MNILHTIVTHLSPEQVRRQLKFLESITPGVPRLIAHGGSKAHFEALADLNPIHLTDESLRRSPSGYCFNELLSKTSSFLSTSCISFDFVHVTEYDHLILRREYFEELSHILKRAGCDFLGQGCNNRTDSDWYHLSACRKNKMFIQFLEHISIHEVKTDIYGTLFDGHTISTVALKAILRGPPLPRTYSEALFPSVIHHMGFRVGDIGTYSNLFHEVHFRPVRTKDEVLAMIERKVPCCHPFKDWDNFEEIERAVLNGR
jgi:hypothetical protein